MNPSSPEPLPLDERLRLAREAYRHYYIRCFWFLRPDLEIGEVDLPEIARNLRLNGGREGWFLAARICP